MGDIKSEVRDITNADMRIRSYLKNTNKAYSQKSLTEKLVSEGYSIETASYAVEKADIDRELMAVKTALALVTLNHSKNIHTVK